MKHHLKRFFSEDQDDILESWKLQTRFARSMPKQNISLDPFQAAECIVFFLISPALSSGSSKCDCKNFFTKCKESFATRAESGRHAIFFAINIRGKSIVIVDRFFWKSQGWSAGVEGFEDYLPFAQRISHWQDIFPNGCLTFGMWRYSTIFFSCPEGTVIHINSSPCPMISQVSFTQSNRVICKTTSVRAYCVDLFLTFPINLGENAHGGLTTKSTNWI